VRELVYRLLAREDLAEIYWRRAEREGFASAAGLVSAIQDRCEALTAFPDRGTARGAIHSFQTEGGDRLCGPPG
jgi:plasmid stabilization system protein ParE